MSIAGKTRLSATLRSSTISELPVPLNSSKITSSIRLPVSISAVAMMVSEPPSSMFRAAPKNRFGRCSALASTPPVSTLPEDGTTVLNARPSRVIEFEQDHHIALVLDQPLGLFDHHLGHRHVPRRRLVEGRRNDLALHRALHVGDFLRPLVDQQHDQVALRDGSSRSNARCSATAPSCRSAAAPRSAPRWPLPIGETRSMIRAERSLIVGSSISIFSRSSG